jgi:hypothetical protein
MDVERPVLDYAMRTPTHYNLLILCFAGFAAPGCTESGITPHPPQIMFEVRTIPAYPVPGQPLEQVLRIQVSTEGKATLWLNNVESKTISLLPAEFSALTKMMNMASFEPDPAVTVDAASTVLTRFRGGVADGSATSAREDAGSIPNKILMSLCSAFQQGRTAKLGGVSP